MSGEDLSPEARRAAEKQADEAEAKLDEAACPPVDFNTFVLSLSTSAIVHLGAAPKEMFGGGEVPPKNLPMAKQTIDCIAMLDEQQSYDLVIRAGNVLGLRHTETGGGEEGS